MGQVLLRNITLAMLVLRMMMLRTMLGALLSKGVFPWNALALPYFDAAWSFIYNHSILAPLLIHHLLAHHAELHPRWSGC